MTQFMGFPIVPHGGLSPAEIRAIRKTHGLTQAALADHLGVQVTTVSRWETGVRRPDPRSRWALRALQREMRPEIAKEEAR